MSKQRTQLAEKTIKTQEQDRRNTPGGLGKQQQSTAVRNENVFKAFFFFTPLAPAFALSCIAVAWDRLGEEHS